MMRALILTPDRDTEGKHDWSGAFRPEAQAFAKHHMIAAHRIVRVDVSKPPAARRSHVEAALSANGPIDVLAFFCHGFRTGLQLGHNMQSVAHLARAIATAAPERLIVALYACSTAAGAGPGGDGGFADRLRDELCRAGLTHCAVNAHDRAGHCTRLPYVRRFAGQGSPVGGTGGQWIVAPGSELWPAWRRALQGPMRHAFPTLPIGEIHRELLRKEVA